MPSVAADAERAAAVLRKICWFVVLAPTSSDQAPPFPHYGVRHIALGKWYA